MSIHIRRSDGRLEGNYSPVESCKDSFKYRLVQEGGRFRFESVRFEGIKGCPAGDLADMVAMIEGQYLEEVDVASLNKMRCRGNKGCGCPQEVARMVLDIQEILLAEQQSPPTEAEVKSAGSS